MAGLGQHARSRDLEMDATPHVSQFQDYLPNPLHSMNPQYSRGDQVALGHHGHLTGVPPTVDHFDAALVFAKDDEELAEEIMNKMNSLELKDGVNPKVCLSDDPRFNAGVVEKAAPIVKMCTLVFVIVTENLQSDCAATFLREEAIGMTRLAPKDEFDNRRRYCVRPLHTKSEKDRKGFPSYRVPCGLTSIDSIDWYQFEKPFFQRKLKQLFEFYLQYRIKREMQNNSNEPVQTATFNPNNSHPAISGSSQFPGHSPVQSQTGSYRPAYPSGSGTEAPFSTVLHQENPINTSSSENMSQQSDGRLSFSSGQHDQTSSVSNMPELRAENNADVRTSTRTPSYRGVVESQSVGDVGQTVLQPPNTGRAMNVSSNLYSAVTGQSGQTADIRTAETSSTSNQHQHSPLPVAAHSESNTENVAANVSMELSMSQSNNIVYPPSLPPAGSNNDDHSLRSGTHDRLVPPTEQQVNTSSADEPNKRGQHSEITSVPTPENHPTRQQSTTSQVHQRQNYNSSISSFENMVTSTRSASEDYMSGSDSIELDTPSLPGSDQTLAKNLHDGVDRLNLRDKKTHIPRNIPQSTVANTASNEEFGFKDDSETDNGGTTGEIVTGRFSVDGPDTSDGVQRHGSFPERKDLAGNETSSVFTGYRRTPGDGQSLDDGMSSKTVASQTSSSQTPVDSKDEDKEHTMSLKDAGTEVEHVIKYDGPAHRPAARCAAGNERLKEKGGPSFDSTTSTPVIHLHYMAGQYVGSSQNSNFFPVPPERLFSGVRPPNTGFQMPYPGQCVGGQSQAPIHITNCQNVQIGQGVMHVSRAPEMTRENESVNQGYSSDDDDDDDSFATGTPDREDRPPPYFRHDPVSLMESQTNRNTSRDTDSTATLVKERMCSPIVTPGDARSQTTRPAVSKNVGEHAVRKESNMSVQQNQVGTSESSGGSINLRTDQPPTTLFRDGAPSGLASPEHLQHPESIGMESLKNVASIEQPSAGGQTGPNYSGEALPELTSQNNDQGESDFSSWTVPSLHDTGEDLMEMLSQDDGEDKHAKGETTPTQKKMPRTMAKQSLYTEQDSREKVCNFRSMFCPNKRREDVYLKTGQQIIGKACIQNLKNTAIGGADVD